MEIEEVEITIGKNGQVRLHVKGMKGKKCLVLTEELEKSLGSEILDRLLTPDALENQSGNMINQQQDIKS